MFIGIDCGTQGTKVIVYDPIRKHICGEGYAAHQLISTTKGAREQDPQWWIDALEISMEQALSSYGGDRSRILGIGVSGQQHGLVILDSDFQVIRNAKIWNDTETASDNQELIMQAGGEDEVISKIGTSIPVGYTASKLVWLRKNDKKAFARISHVLNPKDFINYYLTGVICTDPGSASGTGYFNVKDGTWNIEMIGLVDDSGILEKALPSLASNSEPIGTIRKDIVDRFGLNSSVLVSAGSGDNMMAAIGTGNVESGIGTLTLGTSGVLSVSTNQNPDGYNPIIQIQCSAVDGWLPTVCTMNATSTTKVMQQIFSIDLKTFDEEMASAQPGADGIIMLPYLNGERMPSFPESKGHIGGLTIGNLSRQNLIRASAESVIYGLRWGRDLLCHEKSALNQIRINGGGSNSKPWVQIVADILNTEVVGVGSKEAGALGAAIHAMCACGLGDIPSLCREHIVLNYQKHAIPDLRNVAIYNDYYKDYLGLRKEIFSI